MEEKTILQIDDSETICAMIKMIVAQKPGYKVIQGRNGEEGLELFKKNKVSLVITDINMPKMSGLDIIKAIEDLANHIYNNKSDIQQKVFEFIFEECKVDLNAILKEIK